MIFLKLYLLLGLILHKVIWEKLKKGRAQKAKETPSFKLTFIKTVKVCILLGIIAQTLLPDILPITENDLPLRITGAIIYTIGLLTAITARIQLGNNWADIEVGQVLEKQEVVARGIYGYVRHPIYTGDLLLLLGLELALNSWLFLGVFILAPVVLLQAMKEEKMLAQALAGYEAYCGRTKRFIPFVV